jgi:DNA polymerase V
MEKRTIGQRHKHIREAVLGLSVTAYATATSVKHVTVYSWESGRTAVPHSVLAWLQEQHGISAGWMLTGKGTMHTATHRAAHQPEPPSAIEQLQERISMLSATLQGLVRNAPEVLAPVLSHSLRVRLPLLSLAVSAGMPTASDDTIEREVDLAEMLLEHPESSYFIRVVGDSMHDAGIHHGDTLIVDCAIPAKQGHIIIAKVYGELTVKRYLIENQQPILRAENPDYQDILITPDMDFTIVGVVRSCIKQL